MLTVIARRALTCRSRSDAAYKLGSFVLYRVDVNHRSLYARKVKCYFIHSVLGNIPMLANSERIAVALCSVTATTTTIYNSRTVTI